MDKYQSIKSFTSAASAYFKHPNEATTSVLQRTLNGLTLCMDLSIFDPGSCVTSEFYMYLYNLANSLESKSPLIWSTLDVLEHACKNYAARQAFIHTYKFSPILAKFLETNLVPDKCTKILKLLQELTYGIEIHWQEAHLPRLLLTLTQLIQSKEEDIVSLSLGVIINLCYRNLPVIYTLTRTIDTKALHRMILKLMSNNLNTRVQCCKLLIIMEHIHKDIPDKVILEFIKVTFENIVKALKNKDSLTLRHIVDFFEDVRQNEQSKSALTSYQNYFKDVKTILERLNGISDSDCAALILEFLLSLVKLKLSTVQPLYSQFVKISIDWILNKNNKYVITKALALIKFIIIESRNTKNFNDVISDLELKALMAITTNVDDDTNELNDKASIETNSKLTEQIQLLSELSKVPNLHAQVTEAFNEQTMRRLLRPVCEHTDLVSSNNWHRYLFHDPTTAFYIHVLGLVADLADHNASWQSLYCELIEKKQIQMIIAIAIFTGDSEVKQKSLQLMSSAQFPTNCVIPISRCLSELEPMLLIQSKSGVLPPLTNKPENLPNIDMTPLPSLAQEGKLDAALSTLNELKNDKITDFTTTAIMDLYEYKLSTLRQSENAIRTNLAAADNFSTHLQHRLAQVIAESSKLHQLLFYSQHNLQTLQSDKVKINAKRQQLEKMHGDQKQEIQGLRKIVEDKSCTMEKMKKELEDATTIINELKQKNQEVTSESQELNKLLSKMQDKLARREQAIEANKEAMTTLALKNEQLVSQCRGYEQEIAEKEASNTKMTEEIKELSRMRDMIYQITAKKLENQNETA